MQQEKIPIENLLVITDDIALPFGKLRMKGKGSDGGHNGLKDIIAVMDSNVYARLRFGVGSEFNPGSQVNYVLGEWHKEEEELMEDRLKTSCEFIKGFATIGLQRTMSSWNNK
jgi:PTH1 family peptidyl-tRNA hydrolase